MQVDAFLLAKEVFQDGNGLVTVDKVLWVAGYTPGKTKIAVYLALSFEAHECDGPKHIEVRFIDPDGHLVGGYDNALDKLEVYKFDGCCYVVMPMNTTFTITAHGLYLAELRVNNELIQSARLVVERAIPEPRGSA